MKTKDEIRNKGAARRGARLDELIRLHFDDKQANFVASIDGNQGEISALTGIPKKSFGPVKARLLEGAAGLLEGALDAPPGSPFYPDEIQHDPSESESPNKNEKPPLIPPKSDVSRHTMITGAGGKTMSVRPITTYESLDELPSESTVLITRVDVQLSAGNGRETWHIEEREPLPFQADYIRRLDAKPKDLVAVKVVGDSMETRLFDDDTVIVDQADTRVPANGKIFALVYAGEMLVKRLQRLPDGALKIISDNPAYEPVLLPADKQDMVIIVGRVKYRSGMGDF